ncbi:M48 family metallopeptidase [Desulfotignum phosphitoxidans]|jgi:putative metalloprotease|uniref:Metalloprotease n=1 Tax=Desulfotignum phosphitoxidans DSM 13687 TaxID=1286635 RepID=S0G2N1_9BACT|nr:M48 family metallopeptidase [Desulfotignum phosphitoxidans]EMS78001.1 metalloprotease [Desulfotignum phosphitoxidans DSM 13687]
MMNRVIICLFCLSVFWGCDNTNLDLATQAGIDVIKAATLSDNEVELLAANASKQLDSKNPIAGIQNSYGIRLEKLVGDRYNSNGYVFDFKVYLSPEINAFAMADGTIRIYSGLMDMMNDEEVLFVVGHEMGHVVEKHIKKKIMLAYAASAVRKGIASQENLAGDVARSFMGGLVQTLLNAQFSQAEEKDADDFGILFLKNHGFDINAAISALKKLDGLGNNHSFLSSHPDPAIRAERLQKQVASPGKIITPSFLDKLIASIIRLFP